MDWTAGYRTDIDYTFGYYRDLAPGLIDFSLLLTGYEPPQRAGRYLELGYGQGVSANIHAAACPGEFWGTDFNPAHAARAQEMASAAGAGAHFSDESFAEMLERDDLPPMDHIVMHGIWTWLSDENRQVLVDTFRKRLRVGGALYISFNTSPGWATNMPLRHILGLHAAGVGSRAQGEMQRIEAAIGFGKQLVKVGARYFQANPGAVTWLDSVAGQNRNYVAHEYFNDHSKPMYFSEIHEQLTEAKLHYAGAALPLEQLDGFNLTAPQRELLMTFPEGVLRETVRDYLMNRMFRRDLYTRGARRLSALERIERLRDLRVILTVQSFAYEVNAGLGQVKLKQDIYEPIVEALAASKGGPKRVGDIAEAKGVAQLAPGALMEALAVLIGSGQAHTAQTDEEIALVTSRTAKLNAHLMERSRVDGDVVALASPVIGGGVTASRFEQMFLGARAGGAKTPKDWARKVLDILNRQNQVLIKDGKPLDGEAANLGELTTQAQAMSDDRLGEFKRLGVVD